MFLRRALALAAATAAATLLATPAAALGTNYNHDGETTYCWHIMQPTKNTKLNETDRVEGYSGKQGCPIVMTVALSKYTVAPFDVVNVTWTVTADFTQRNLVNMTKVVYGPDSAGNPAHIVHSNVHSCVFGTGCDPFNDGEALVDKTTNKIANFSDNHVTFVDSLKFPKTGDYSILAHIILPEANASRRFDYAVYAELVVKDAPVTAAPVATAAPAPTSDAANGDGGSGGLSTGATAGIIVTGVVVVAALVAAVLIVRRRRSDAPSPSQGYMAPPAYDASLQLLAADSKRGGDGADGARPGYSDVTATATSAGFQSAWSGPALAPSGGRPSQNLDGTGASGSSYASYERESQASGSTAAAAQRATAPNAAGMYRESSLASSGATTATRPRRVDSDVEL